MCVENWWRHLAVSDRLSVFCGQIQYPTPARELPNLIDGVTVLRLSSPETLNSARRGTQAELVVGRLRIPDRFFSITHFLVATFHIPSSTKNMYA